MVLQKPCVVIASCHFRCSKPSFGSVTATPWWIPSSMLPRHASSNAHSWPSFAAVFVVLALPWKRRASARVDLAREMEVAQICRSTAFPQRALAAESDSSSCSLLRVCADQTNCARAPATVAHVPSLRSVTSRKNHLLPPCASSMRVRRSGRAWLKRRWATKKILKKWLGSLTSIPSRIQFKFMTSPIWRTETETLVLVWKFSRSSSSDRRTELCGYKPRICIRISNVLVLIFVNYDWLYLLFLLLRFTVKYSVLLFEYDSFLGRVCYIYICF